MYGLTEKGFKPKDLNTIKKELEEELKSEVHPTLHFGEGSVGGMLTGIVAKQCRQVWESLNALYHSLKPDAATGQALDALCSLTGTYRRKAAPSRVKALIKLSANTTLPKGSIAAVDGASRFRTVREVKNESNEEAIKEADLLADEPGPIYAPATKLNQKLTPQAGWLDISNPKDAVLGHFDETDEALRLRRLNELRTLGSSTHDSMRAHLSALPGVLGVYIAEGQHEFTAYVMGGDEAAICETLWRNKPLGVHTTGNIAHLVKASNSQEYVVNFSRPTAVLLSLHIDLKVKKSLDEAEVSNLKSKIIDHLQEHIRLGDEPYPSRLYAIIFAETKILDVMSIRLNPEVKALKPYELATFDISRIFIEQMT